MYILNSILLSARNDRAFQLGQAMALPIVIGVGLFIYFRRRKKQKAAENAKKDLLD